MGSPASALVLLLALVGGGALVLYLTLRKGIGWRKKMRGYFYGSLIVGLLMTGLGVGLAYLSSEPSTITVSPGALSVQSPWGFGTGNLNVASGDVSRAYVSQIGSGNLTLSKQYGTSDGDLNIGVFTLGSGATAYVVSDNSTDLIIHLKTGDYLVLGTSDTAALASAFTQWVDKN